MVGAGAPQTKSEDSDAHRWAPGIGNTHTVLYVDSMQRLGSFFGL